ncbi:MAG: hypothetical protein ABIJ56_15770 [Pseudomonadota bacterium]
MTGLNARVAPAALSILAATLLFSTYLEAAHPDIDRLAHETGSTAISWVARPFQEIPQVISGFSWRSCSSDPELNALDFLAAFPDLAGIGDPCEDLVHESTVRVGESTFVRFEQVYGGLPVTGRAVIIKTDASGSVITMAGNAMPAESDIELQPQRGEAEAMDIAAASVEGGLKRAPAASLQVLINPGEAALVWAVSVGTLAPAGSWVVLVDAATGEVRGRINRLYTATGKAYENNPEHGDAIEIEIQRLEGDQDVLEGPYVNTWRYMGTTDDAVHSATPDGEGNFLYDPSEEQPDFEDPFAEVHSYYHIDKQVDFMVETFDYPMTRGPIDLYVNYYQSVDGEGNPEPYDNAQFDGEGWTIEMGQGPTKDYSYDAAILYHEYGHSIVDSIAHLNFMAADKYGLILLPGAIHEGTADYWAATLTDDPDMSEYINIHRNLVNANKCPDDMMGEGHFDGLVVGRTFWEIREEFGREITDDIVYRALHALTPNASLAQYAAAAMGAVDDLIGEDLLTEGDRTTIEGIFAETGMDICERVIALDGGIEYSTYLFGLIYLNACDYLGLAELAGYSFPSAFQWSIDVPEDATSLSVDLRVETLTPGEESHALHVRGGTYVEFELIELFGGFYLPLRVNAADHSVENTLGIEIDLNSDPPLQPGEPYYIAITYLSCPMATYTISAETSNDPLPDPVPEAVEDDIEEDVPDETAEEQEPAAEVEGSDASDADGEDEEPDDDSSGEGCGCQTVT